MLKKVWLYLKTSHIPWFRLLWNTQSKTFLAFLFKLLQIFLEFLKAKKFPQDSHFVGYEIRLRNSQIVKRFSKIAARNDQFFRKLRIKLFWWLNIFFFRIALLALLISWPSTQISQVPPQNSPSEFK